MDDDPRRHIPSVADVLQLPNVAALVDTHGHRPVVNAIRETLVHLRANLSTIDVRHPTT